MLQSACTSVHYASTVVCCLMLRRKNMDTFNGLLIQSAILININKLNSLLSRCLKQFYFIFG